MASYNRVILIGNLTRGVELRYTPSKVAVADMCIAVNDKRKEKDGTWVEDTTYVEITLWSNIAEIAAKYTEKGSQVMIEGRLQMDQWEKDGKKRSKLKVIGERLVMLGGGTYSNSGKRESEAAGIDPVPEPRSAQGEDIPF